MIIAPFFGRSGRVFNARQDLLDSPPPRVLVLKFAVELAINSDQGGGTAHDEGDLVIGIALVDEDYDTCKCRDIVLD